MNRVLAPNRFSEDSTLEFSLSDTQNNKTKKGNAKNFDFEVGIFEEKK